MTQGFSLARNGQSRDDGPSFGFHLIVGEFSITYEVEHAYLLAGVNYAQPFALQSDRIHLNGGLGVQGGIGWSLGTKIKNLEVPARNLTIELLIQEYKLEISSPDYVMGDQPRETFQAANISRLLVRLLWGI